MIVRSVAGFRRVYFSPPLLIRDIPIKYIKKESILQFFLFGIIGKQRSLMTNKQKEGILFLGLIGAYLINMPSLAFVTICIVLLFLDFRIGEFYQLFYVFMISIFVKKYDPSLFVSLIFFLSGSVLIYQFVQEKRIQKKKISADIKAEKLKRSKRAKKKKTKKRR